MDDERRTASIDQLKQRHSVATTRRTALTSQMQDFAAHLSDVGETLGNPYFYSGENHGRPENANKSTARFSGYKSHEPGLQLLQALKAADLDLNTLREQLRGLGVNVE